MHSLHLIVWPERHGGKTLPAGQEEECVARQIWQHNFSTSMVLVVMYGIVGIVSAPG